MMYPPHPPIGEPAVGTFFMAASPALGWNVGTIGRLAGSVETSTKRTQNVFIWGVVSLRRLRAIFLSD